MALDTESDSLYHYFEKVCLLQIADAAGRVALVDTMVLRDLSALKPLMADPSVEKILHAAEGDIALLRRDFGLDFAGIFDTHVAGRFCGRGELGLQTLLEREIGVKLGKNMQRCDWSRRPLTRAQELYAADDVRYLRPLREQLAKELRERGRESWAAEEFEALARLEPAPHREPVDFMKIKGAWDLGPRDWAILRNLVALRDEWARRADLPLFKVVGDEVLVALATRRPRTPQDLGGIKGMPYRLRERLADQVLGAIRQALALPEDQLPVRPRFKRQRMTMAESRRVDRLKAWRSQAAPRLGLDPGALLPQRLIERIALDGPADLAALAAVEGIRRWRIEAFGAELVAALQA